jgi:hypothetical protein
LHTQKPLPLHQFLRFIRCLKVVLFKALQDDPELFADVKFGSETDGKARDGDLEIWTGLAATQRRVMCHSMRMVGVVLADLYSRWARRPFSSATLWEVKVRRACGCSWISFFPVVWTSQETTGLHSLRNIVKTT